MQTAPTFTETASGESLPSLPRERTPSPLPKFLIAAAVILAIGAGGMWWHSKRGHGSGVSPLEASGSAGRVLVPPDSEMARHGTAGPAKGSITDAPDGSSPLASIAVATATSGADAIESLRSMVTEFTTGLTQANERIATIETSDRTQNEQIAQLRNDVDQLKLRTTTRSQAPSPRSSGRDGSAATGNVSDEGREDLQPKGRYSSSLNSQRAPQAGQLAAQQDSARYGRSSDRRSRAAPSTQEGDVIAVDTWGGKPSVAVVTAGDGRHELKFLAEGDAHGELTLRQADTAAQRARFTSRSGGDITLAPRESGQ